MMLGPLDTFSIDRDDIHTFNTYKTNKNMSSSSKGQNLSRNFMQRDDHESCPFSFDSKSFAGDGDHGSPIAHHHQEEENYENFDTRRQNRNRDYQNYHSYRQNKSDENLSYADHNDAYQAFNTFNALWGSHESIPPPRPTNNNANTKKYNTPQATRVDDYGHSNSIKDHVEFVDDVVGDNFSSRRSHAASYYDNPLPPTSTHNKHNNSQINSHPQNQGKKKILLAARTSSSSLELNAHSIVLPVNKDSDVLEHQNLNDQHLKEFESFAQYGRHKDASVNMLQKPEKDERHVREFDLNMIMSQTLHFRRELQKLKSSVKSEVDTMSSVCRSGFRAVSTFTKDLKSLQQVAYVKLEQQVADLQKELLVQRSTFDREINQYRQALHTTSRAVKETVEELASRCEAAESRLRRVGNVDDEIRFARNEQMKAQATAQEAQSTLLETTKELARAERELTEARGVEMSLRNQLLALEDQTQRLIEENSANSLLLKERQEKVDTEKNKSTSLVLLSEEYQKEVESLHKKYDSLLTEHSAQKIDKQEIITKLEEANTMKMEMRDQLKVLREENLYLKDELENWGENVKIQSLLSIVFSKDQQIDKMKAEIAHWKVEAGKQRNQSQLSSQLEKHPHTPQTNSEPVVIVKNHNQPYHVDDGDQKCGERAIFSARNSTTSAFKTQHKVPESHSNQFRQQSFIKNETSLDLGEQYTPLVYEQSVVDGKDNSHQDQNHQARPVTVNSGWTPFTFESARLLSQENEIPRHVYSNLGGDRHSNSDQVYVHVSDGLGGLGAELETMLHHNKTFNTKPPSASYSQHSRQNSLYQSHQQKSHVDTDTQRMLNELSKELAALQNSSGLHVTHPMECMN